MSKGFAGGLLLFVALAEVAASVAVWHGTPTDWRGAPLRLWDVEFLRLRYWCGWELLLGGLWAIWWIYLRRRIGGFDLLILGTCGLSADVITSVFFWRSLTVTQVGYLGWPSLQHYVVEHAISWAVTTLLVLAGWYLVSRRKMQASAPPQVLNG